MKSTQVELLDELHNYAEAIRNDWGDFDGRELLRTIDDWISRFYKEEYGEKMNGKKKDLVVLFQKYLIVRVINGKAELIDATNNKEKAEKMIKSFEGADSLYFIAEIKKAILKRKLKK